MLLADALRDDQDEFRRTARRLLEGYRASARGGPAPALWGRIGRELAWTALAIPEAHGGLGPSYLQLGVLFEELGRALTPSPFFATVIAAAALHHGGHTTHLAPIAAGECTAALALTGDVLADGTVLRGRLRQVVDGSSADVLVVRAGEALYVVAGSSAGVTRRSVPALDATRPMADIELQGAPGEKLAEPALGYASNIARVVLAAEQLGGAERCLDMAVEYAKLRVQFGRPIGSFQAVKHILADMLVRVESARSAVRYATWVADTAPMDLPVAAAIAHATAAQAYLSCAGDSIQVHGGVGFTWEHDAHLHLKRARVSATLFGTLADDRALALRQMGL